LQQSFIVVAVSVLNLHSICVLDKLHTHHSSTVQQQYNETGSKRNQTNRFGELLSSFYWLARFLYALMANGNDKNA